jgi:hypothetical protein
VQRKCRCTYVKFHRQTAPAGPGHSNPRPANVGAAAGALPAGNPPSASARLPAYPHTDDFLLGGHQQPVVPSMAENIYSQSLGFQPFYAHASDPGNADLGGAKYRQPPDPYRRASVPLSAQTSTAPGAGMIPGLYTDPRQGNWLGWGQENGSSFTSSNHHPGAMHGNESRY